MIISLTVNAQFTVPDSGAPVTVRTQLEPCDNAVQEVRSASTSSPRAVAPPTRLRAPDGTRTALLELAPGPATVQATATVALLSPLHLTQRIPATSWEQCAAHIHGIRSSGRTADGAGLSVPEALFIAAASMPSPGATPDDDTRDLAFSTFLPGQPLITGIAEVAAQIAARGLDPVAATHRMIGAMRALGLAAGYAIGIGPDEALTSWASIYIPGFGWFEIDVNRVTPIPAGAVILVWGRDRLDVPLVRLLGGDDDVAITATLTRHREEET